jgi:histone H3/H4
MKITKTQFRRIIREAIDPREMEEPLGGWAGDALTNDPDYYHPDDTDTLKVTDLVRSVDYRGDGWGGDYKRVVGDQIGTVIEVDKDPDGIQYTVLFPDGTTVMDTASEFELINEGKMKITRRQLRRIIRESLDTHNMDPNRAHELIAILQEFGYELFLPPAMDSNNIAIDDALGGYPGEFTYEELMTAVRIVQGRGA